MDRKLPFQALCTCFMFQKSSPSIGVRTPDYIKCLHFPSLLQLPLPQNTFNKIISSADQHIWVTYYYYYHTQHFNLQRLLLLLLPSKYMALCSAMWAQTKTGSCPFTVFVLNPTKYIIATSIVQVGNCDSMVCWRPHYKPLMELGLEPRSSMTKTNSLVLPSLSLRAG